MPPGGYSFQGREWDPEVGLYISGPRYYNATGGRHGASDDPIGFSGGANFTRFVTTNPVRFTDPSGLCSGDEEQRDRPKMSMSANGRKMIRTIETENRSGEPSLEQYETAKGNGDWTIGFGHRLRPGEMYVGRISRATAERLFEQDIAEAERAINERISVPLRQHEFDALVDFAFNSGRGTLNVSSLRRHINNNDIVTVTDFTVQNPGGKVGKGVDNRKNIEAVLFFHGRYDY